MKQSFFIMLGYPCSGKSYFARKLADHYRFIRLNGDSIRYAMFDNEEDRGPQNNHLVFSALDYVTKEILRSGHSVIYDASHNKASNRESASSLALPFSLKPILIWVQVPLDIARERLMNREKLPDQPIISDKRFNQLVGDLHAPNDNELCIIIDGSKPFADQLISFQSQVEKINL